MPVKIEDLLGEIAKLAPPPQKAIRIEYRSSPSANWDIKVIFGDPAQLPKVRELLADQSVVKQLDIKGASAFVTFRGRLSVRRNRSHARREGRYFAAGRFQGQR